MALNWKKELKITIGVYLIVNFINFFFYTLLYYYFNIDNFPPKFGILFWLTVILVIACSNYFLIKQLLKKQNLKKKRYEIILYSSLIINAINLFTFSNFLEYANYKSITIENVEVINKVNSFEYNIDNFQIINNPKVFFRIKRQSKPIRIYTEVFYTFPFKSEAKNIYYAILFKEQIDSNLSESEENNAMNNFIKKSEDSIKNYNFYENKKFQYLTKMFREIEGFEKTLPQIQQKNIFLMPIKKSLISEFQESKMFTLKVLFVFFLAYIFLFFLTKVEEWK